MKVTVLNPFTLDPDVHSLDHGIKFDDPSLTVQADAEQADINYIVKQFGVTGGLPYGKAQPFYDDVTDFPVDYHSAMNHIRQADELFLELPATVRAEFDNDAGNFLNALSDPSKADRLRELGVLLPASAAPNTPASPESPPAEPTVE